MQNKKQYKLISCIILGILMIFTMLVNFLVDDKIEFLVGNLVPELIGICIEILIIIWLFDYWQNKKEHNQLVKYEKRLREYLIFFLKNSFKNLPKDIQVGDFYGQNFNINKNEIQKLIEYLNHNEVEIEIFKSMKKQLLIDKTAYENLLEVASLLTDKHMKAWVRIVYFINKLDKLHGDNLKEYKVTIILILRQIKQFDQASFDNKIYVGAN